MEVLNNFIAHSATWGVMLTLGVYALGTLFSRKTGWAVCNPLLLGSLFVMLFLAVSGIPYIDYKNSAASVSYLLLPATVSLAIPLYEKWDLLMKNARAIIAGIVAGVLSSLASVVIMSHVLDMNPGQTATLLPKSVTTAIGMDIAAELGGIPSLAAAVIIVTGIVGNVSAEFMCGIFRITDPTAKGIAIGSSSHAIGTAKALQMGDTEGAMSGLTIAAAGLITALLAPLAYEFL